MKKRRHVPHPGHFDGLKELVSEAGKDIYSIFMAGSSGKAYIRSLLPIYHQIGRICELEFEYTTLYDIVGQK
jgi:hypothetical protein